jgi:hypothetical protein
LARLGQAISTTELLRSWAAAANGTMQTTRYGYDIVACCRRQILAKMGYPLSRLFQERFAEGLKAAMTEAACGQMVLGL